jgi:diguanylate cyclase (GGDEF)-like protein/PAS domain S-box-containing protein
MATQSSSDTPGRRPSGLEGDDLDAAATVLFIEDSEGDATVVMAALEEPAGRFVVRWVTSLEAALSTLVDSRYECLVVDLGLPDADGLEALDALRGKAGDAAIVVLTGSVDDTLGVQAIARGADDFLVKDQMWKGQLPRSIDYAIERARSKVVLRETSARSAAVMAAMSDAILVVGADGRVVSANPAAEALSGVPAAALVGQPIKGGNWCAVDRGGTAVPDDERPALVTLATGQPVRGVVTGVRNGDGDVVWVEVNTNPLHTPDGQLDGVVVSMRDISERFAAEKATRFQAALLAAVGQAVIVIEPQGQIVFWNPAAEAMYGWTAAEALGRMAMDLVVPAESVAQAREIVQVLTNGESWTGDFLMGRRDGTPLSVLLTNTPIIDEQGALVAVIGVSTDISERKQAEETAQALAAIVESTADAIFTTAIDGTILSWNRGAEQLYGYAADEVVGHLVSMLQPIEARAEIRSILVTVAAGDTVRGLETVRQHRDGTNVDVSLTVSPIVGDDGSVVAASAITRDITDRRRLERELIRQAMHDGLTGLPNRTLLTDRLSQTLAGAARRHLPVAVLFCDLDQFKTVNDASGHLAGDELLVEVARRLQGAIRPSDTVARFGGDEFVLVCEDADTAEARRIADRVAEALTDPITANGQRLYVSASIGIAVTPPLEARAETLLRCADAAMYDAKAHGRARWRVFDTSLAEQSCERLELTNDLREALTEEALEVHYQPVVQLATGDLVGVEALIRWQHPIRGWVPPALFVPLAEEAGLIWSLDQWVLAQACRHAAALRASGVLAAHARLAVNISARNIADPDLVDVVRDSAAAAGLPFDALELEVTETGLMADAIAARRVLQELRELGVGVALDDFGTGYSSLTNVRQLPVTTLKIDRGFIQHITDRPDDLAIAAAVIDLAQAVGLRTIAEGVETPEQLSLLHRMGCCAGQGYLWSMALSSEELAERAKRRPLRFLAATDEQAPLLPLRR